MDDFVLDGIRIAFEPRLEANRFELLHNLTRDRTLLKALCNTTVMHADTEFPDLPQVTVASHEFRRTRSQSAQAIYDAVFQRRFANRKWNKRVEPSNVTEEYIMMTETYKMVSTV